MSHIFISYSRKDSPCAYRIARILEGQGFKIWIDKDDIPPGAPFPMKIFEAIRNASAMIILWSANSQSSDYVKHELEEAQNQYMHRRMPIIPIWLDDTPLHPILKSINAKPLRDCNHQTIIAITKSLTHLRYRKINEPKLIVSQPIGEQGAVPLETLPNLVKLPIATSQYCNGYIIAEPHLSLQTVKNYPEKKVQVFLEFLGGVNNEENIRKIYQHIQTEIPEKPFFLFHFTGHEVDGQYKLIDTITDSPAGDWLDAVHVVYNTLDEMIGREGALLQIFNALPASLNFAIGMQFFKFWHVLLYHYVNNQGRYQLVIDSRDISTKAT